MSNGRTLKRLIEKGLAGLDDINAFRQDLWNLWSGLYLEASTRFPYDTPDRDGIFFVASRKKYAKNAEGGDLVTYSEGLTREEKYSRDTFNLKVLDLRDAAMRTHRTLYFISNEAPLLRPVRGRLAGIQRIHADLVAVADDGSLVVLEAKDAKKGADPLPSALLQAYAYAFFLACHIANKHDAVVGHARKSLEKFHGKGKGRVPGLSSCRGVQYCVIAPRGYFEGARATAKPDPDSVLKALSKPIHIQAAGDTGAPRLPEGPAFAGFIVSEFNSHRDWDSMQRSL